MKSRDITPAMRDRMPYPVQTHIQHLERKVEEQDALIKRLRTVADRDCDHGLIVDPHSEYPIYFNPMNTVRFWIEPGKFYIDCRVEWRGGANAQPYLAVSGGGHTCTGFIGIRPNSGNTCEIHREDR